MRLVLVAILAVAALGAGVSASKPKAAPFDGAWMSCQTWQGARICVYKLLVQRGDRVCGIQSDFATNAYYYQRFVGTARANSLHIDKICGDPGSETDTYCAGSAPASARKVGWGTSTKSLFACGGRLHVASNGDGFRCASAIRSAGLPKVRSLKGQGPEAEDRAWLAACASGNGE
jgi:hypothetical protein